MDRNVTAHGTRNLAEAYLRFLYTPAAQEVIARNFYRPRDPAVAKRHAADFRPIRLFAVDRNFGGWRRVQKIHFSEGGVYDQIVADNAR